MRLLTLAGCLSTLLLVNAGDARYRGMIERWRAQHQAELKSEQGWLAVAGLFWLKPGANSAGSAPSNDIVLPGGPEKAGVFELRGGRVTFRPSPGSGVLVNGKPAGSAGAVLKPDDDGTPDQIRIDRLTLSVLHRGDRLGIRLRDLASKQRTAFAGLHWFPVNESYRVNAKFTVYPKPKMIPITNVLGQTELEASPGYVTFVLNGRELRLEPVAEDDRLFFIFAISRRARKRMRPAGFCTRTCRGTVR
jgi:uncharacterized protein (DUF1684 family)